MYFHTAEVNKYLEGIAQWPSAVLAVIFAVSACLHLLQSHKYHSWVYTWPLVPACLMMTGGLICREITAHTHEPTELSSAVQGLFYASTPIFTLPLYFFLLRVLETPALGLELFYRCQQHHRHGHRPTFMSGLFICVVSCLNTVLITLIAQGAATYFGWGHDQASMAAGLRCLQASQVLQLVMDVALLVALIAVRFGHAAGYMPFGTLEDRRIWTVLTTLITLMALLLVHNGFRTLQIFAKPGGLIWLNEVYFWGLEVNPMLLFTGLFHIKHPAWYMDLQSSSGECRAMGSCGGGRAAAVEEQQGIPMDCASTSSSTGGEYAVKTTVM